MILFYFVIICTRKETEENGTLLVLNGAAEWERKERKEERLSFLDFLLLFPPPTKVTFFQVTASLAEDESARIKLPFPGVTKPDDEVLDELNKRCEYLSMK